MIWPGRVIALMLLRRAIIEEGQRASILMTLITSLFVLAASMLVIFVPLLKVLKQEGLFSSFCLREWCEVP